MEGKEWTIPDQLGWGIGTESVDHVSFLGSDYDESVMLGDFGWTVPADSGDFSGCDGGFFDFYRIESDLAGSDCRVVDAEDKSTPNVGDDSNRSIHEPNDKRIYRASDLSPSSSEDPTEKPTEPGGLAVTAAGKPPLDTESKVRKKGQKRTRQPQFAFVTKSEIDHLEDGYRWRKYGQKAVKNSPFPSYYRCTNSKCMVKKRVERSREDPTAVITTYEGQHCHYSVEFPARSFRCDAFARPIAPAAAAAAASNNQFCYPTATFLQHHMQQTCSILISPPPPTWPSSNINKEKVLADQSGLQISPTL
ncbi:probable WRKY transcription factor 57 isoform X2 [Andrographis paniculata]|uniref:probable WRKY transcription factor 57 isoform X2 n=1 Tax=Andrographis paniculata TaxID=175694 RepID=UPI0021E769F3|nr:probable WRKY transcription factor 57 isoform X2 [Andrographis paniculata]